MHNHINPVIVFGLYETAIGVAQSLWKRGIPVYGIGRSKEIGYYSRFMKTLLFPDPQLYENNFITQLTSFISEFKHPPVLMNTSDLYLETINKFRPELSKTCLINMPSASLLKSILNKYELFHLCIKNDIVVPNTIQLNSIDDLSKLKSLKFPVFLKPLNVLKWRNEIDPTIKGYRVNSADEAITKAKPLLDRKIELIGQEIIQGPDTNHYKFCGYYTNSGKLLAGFTLQKIRQYPPHFGIGSCVKSIHNPELFEIGNRLFSRIDYTGVGSAEFKLDERDGQLKLIEINARYWQQIALATYSGVNFPYMHYCDLTARKPAKSINYKAEVRWYNKYADENSFRYYHKKNNLSHRDWIKSRKKPRIVSDFSWSDPLLHIRYFGPTKWLKGIIKKWLRML